MSARPRAAPSRLAAANDLREQMRELPAFRALLRSAEEGLVRGLGPLAGPVLDLGCGDGHFGARALGGGAIGTDPDLDAIAVAGRRRGHRALVAADGSRLPISTGSMGTVVANSVLEHIPALDETLAECARVLRPGGRLVITAPSDRFTPLLGGVSVPRAIGLEGWGERYGRWLNRRSRHHHLLSLDQWTERLGSAGLGVLSASSYFPRAAHRTFEALHFLGIPTLLFRRLTGRWVPWRNPVTSFLAGRLLARHCDAAAVDDGAYVFLVAGHGR